MRGASADKSPVAEVEVASSGEASAPPFGGECGLKELLGGVGEVTGR